MKILMSGLFLSILAVQSSYAQQPPAPPTETIKTAASLTPEQQEVIDLSKMKSDWMADKTKVSRLEENLGAIDVQLTEDDLKRIEDATSKLSLEGARLPEAMLKMTGR